MSLHFVTDVISVVMDEIAKRTPNHWENVPGLVNFSKRRRFSESFDNAVRKFQRNPYDNLIEPNSTLQSYLVAAYLENPVKLIEEEHNEVSFDKSDAVESAQARLKESLLTALRNPK